MDRLWIQDQLACLGLCDGFLNADEMSRNMPTLLAERPRVFLPQYDDDEVISYAERARANRASCPWAMQHAHCTSASSSAGPTGMRC